MVIKYTGAEPKRPRRAAKAAPKPEARAPGRPFANEKTVAVSFRATEALNARILRAAAAEGQKVSAYLAALLDKKVPR